ncbi:MAG: HAD hydrolase-like protein, partial [Candidatus Marinimicrobia bacterium]|nr:HAD hydrolase-like protein [Candidatus Neomarinimicrobiota bacterium]
SPGPAPRLALAEAISDFLGSGVDLDFHDVAGYTDPVIVRNALSRNGYRGDISEKVVTGIIDHYLDLVVDRLPQSNGVSVFPGAEMLVRACQAENWITGLLTGNVRKGAQTKLNGTGLWNLFAFGVFGEDGNGREDLPWIALERAWDITAESFRPENTIIIGDTPNDARIAARNNMKSLIVCRRPEPEWRESIMAQNPTWIIDDFNDTQAIINRLKQG